MVKWYTVENRCFIGICISDLTRLELNVHNSYPFGSEESQRQELGCHACGRDCFQFHNSVIPFRSQTPLRLVMALKSHFGQWNVRDAACHLQALVLRSTLPVLCDAANGRKQEEKNPNPKSPLEE